MSRLAFAVALSFVVVAAPAAAATWAFGGSVASNLTAVSTAVAGEPTLSVVARKFTPAPGSLTSLSQLATAGLVDRNASSIGIIGGANSQLDTNSPRAREAFLVTSTRALQLTGVKLSVVDVNDTFQIYGVGAGGALVSLGFPGTIGSGFGGSAGFVNNGMTTTLTFANPLAAFNQFVFTTRDGGDVLSGGDLGQGFRLDNISGVVPEPASWAMLIAGFGLIGGALRHRRDPQAQQSNGSIAA